jgi:hypothetical protein
MNKQKQNRIPVYMTRETKKKIEQLKYDIWRETGRNMALSQIIRDITEEQLQNRRNDILRRYSMGDH